MSNGVIVFQGAGEAMPATILNPVQESLPLGGAAQFEGNPDTQSAASVIAEVDAARASASVEPEMAFVQTPTGDVQAVEAVGSVAITLDAGTTEVVTEASDEAQETLFDSKAFAEAEVQPETFKPLPKITVKQRVYHFDARDGDVRMVIQNCGLNAQAQAVDCDKPASSHYQNGVLEDGVTKDQALAKAIEAKLLPAGSTQADLDLAGNDAALFAVLNGKEYLLVREMNVEGYSGQITDVTVKDLRNFFAEQYGLKPSDAQLRNLELRLNIESAGWTSLDEGVEIKHETTTTTPTTTSTTSTTSTTIPCTSTTTTTVPGSTTTAAPTTSTSTTTTPSTTVAPPTTKVPPFLPPSTTVPETFEELPPYGLIPPDITWRLPPQESTTSTTTATTTTIVGRPELPPALAETGGSSFEMGAIAVVGIAVGALAVRVAKLRRKAAAATAS